MTTATKPRKRKAISPGLGPGTGTNGNGQAAVDLATIGARAQRRAGTPAPADLDVKSIEPSPFQPRSSFPEAELRGLAESIGQQGQLQPILVRPLGGSGRYELVDGERRLRAVRDLLRLPTIRAEVGDFSDSEARAIALTSALQRADLNPVEEAGRDRLTAVLGFNITTVPELAADFVGRMFWDQEAPCWIVPAADVLRVTRWAEISPADAWADDQAGPLSEAYWNLHNKEQLPAQPGRRKRIMGDDGGNRLCFWAGVIVGVVGTLICLALGSHLKWIN